MEHYELDARSPRREILRGHVSLGGRNPAGNSLAVTSSHLEFDGVPVVPAMGEFQFSRYPCLAWDEELVKLKMGGLTIVASYVFWIHHEEEEGRFDWSGNRNIRYFVELCRRHGLRVLLRIGPFAHGEDLEQVVQAGWDSRGILGPDGR